MEKIINIGGVDVKLSNNVGWTMEYRDQFGEDIIPKLLPMAQSITEALAAVFSEYGANGFDAKTIAEALQGRTLDIMIPLTQLSFTDLIIGITWAMAKDADPNIDPPRQWVRQFESFPVDEIVPEVLDLVKRGFTSSKNLSRLEGMLAQIKKSDSTKSSSQGLNVV